MLARETQYLDKDELKEYATGAIVAVAKLVACVTIEVIQAKASSREQDDCILGARSRGRKRRFILTRKSVVLDFGRCSRNRARQNERSAGTVGSDAPASLLRVTIPIIRPRQKEPCLGRSPHPVARMDWVVMHAKKSERGYTFVLEEKYQNTRGSLHRSLVSHRRSATTTTQWTSLVAVFCGLGTIII